MLEEMRQAGVEPDAFIYSRLVTVCEKSKQWQQALSLLEDAGSGRCAVCTQLGAAISACEKRGQWQKALSLLEKMRAAGIAPNVILFNAAIQACAKVEQPAAALQTFELAERAVEPDCVTFDAVLDAVAIHVPSAPNDARALWRWAFERSPVEGFGTKGRAKLDLQEHSERAAETGCVGGWRRRFAAVSCWC